MRTMTKSVLSSPAQGPAMHVFCLCAQWCGTCREYQPVFAQLASQWPEVKFVWVDIENHDDLLGDLDIENFPTLLIADAQGQARFAGTVLPHAETLQRMCQAALAGDFPLINDPDWQNVTPDLMQLD
ncbi:MAG: thioredoxin [Betaproteobacteria bacterium]|jgi:thiol-disulfide isomerase/thioredoxin|nr:thioredoxin [Betaproteobacteria bacterium]